MGRGHCFLLLASSLLGCSGTPPGDLGVRAGRLTPCPTSPNCVSSQEERVTRQIAPLAAKPDPSAAFARLASLLEARSDARIVEQQEGYLRVEFRTTLGFVDDGEFLLDPGQGVIHLRSASRLGWSDLGKNRRRLEEIRAAFTQEPLP